MSKKHRNECCCDEKKGFLGNCCCDFPTLIILILILLQFNKRGGLFGANAVDGYKGAFESVDNSILFIIALFYLSCCNPCKRIGY